MNRRYSSKFLAAANYGDEVRGKGKGEGSRSRHFLASRFYAMTISRDLGREKVA